MAVNLYDEKLTLMASIMKYLLKYLFTLSLAALLSACGGGSSSDTINDASMNSRNKMTISGSVGDGPIQGATVILKSRNGSVLATTTSNQQAGYTLSVIVESDDFPLLLEASNGIDLVTDKKPDFTLVSVVPNRSITHANLNPYSSILVMTANSMRGGINESNLEQARKTIIGELNFGIDIDLIPDPMTIKIDSSNLPAITYASEALAEMIRRSSAVLGNQVSEDAILHSLASDLIDGLLDGKGSPDINSLHTTVAQTVSLQVLLESMLQELKVNGVSAETKLTDAITTVLGTSHKPPRSFRSDIIKWPMLKQTRVALTTIQQIDPDITYRDIMRKLVDLGEHTTTDEISAALKQIELNRSISNTIDRTIAQVAKMTVESIDAVTGGTNPDGIDDVVTFDTSVTVPDSPTNPQTTTEVNTDNAQDISTTFEINTPDTADAGLYEDTVISVSDGIARVSMETINILVTSNTIAMGSADLSWKIPKTRTDGSPLALSEIAGYRIYMGQTNRELNMILDLNDGSINTHSVSELTTGTYYFSVTTYDTEGNESRFSNIAEKTIL